MGYWEGWSLGVGIRDGFRERRGYIGLCVLKGVGYVMARTYGMTLSGNTSVRSCHYGFSNRY